MSLLAIEHVKAKDLPEQWVHRLNAKPEQSVTVRIETEPERTDTGVPEAFVTEDPAFGIWRDREDIPSAEAYLQKLRAPRYASN